MNLAELTRRFRVWAQDQVHPYLFSDEDVADWMTDAQVQAAVRARLLFDDTTPAVCTVAVVSGVASYPLHPALYELVLVRFKATGATCSIPLRIVSREWLTDHVRDWRDATDWQGSSKRFCVQSETGLRIVPIPDEAGDLLIEGYRLPLNPLVNDTDKPEIHEASHEKLIQWALHRAFSLPDTEGVDPNRAAAAEREFTAYFGPMPDADMRRMTREDEVQHNVSYPP